MSVRAAVFVVAAGLALAVCELSAQAPSLKSVMQGKVANTEALLRPLVVSDFALLDRYAERLGRITYTEISSWQARPEAGYSKQASNFIQAVQGLRAAAAAKDVGLAGENYIKLVSSCVECHRYARSARVASGTDARGDVRGQND